MFGALILLLFLFLSVIMTFFSSKILHCTLLQREESGFILEIPPLRKPNLKKIIRDTLRNKCAGILVRAVLVSVPAGMIIWMLQTIKVSDQAALYWVSQWLDPVAALIGLNGAILLAFILSLPANELVLPIAIMILSGNTVVENLMQNISGIFLDCHITWKTALCMIVFLMFHWPCLNTIITINKELHSYKWTMIGILLPTCVGVILCWLITILW